MTEKTATDIEKGWNDYRENCKRWAEEGPCNTLETPPSIDSILKTIEHGRSGDLPEEWESMMRLLRIIRGHQITNPAKMKTISDMMEDIIAIYDKTDDREWTDYAIAETEKTLARLKIIRAGL